MITIQVLIFLAAFTVVVANDCTTEYYLKCIEPLTMLYTHTDAEIEELCKTALPQVEACLNHLLDCSEFEDMEPVLRTLKDSIGLICTDVGTVDECAVKIENCFNQFVNAVQLGAGQMTTDERKALCDSIISAKDCLAALTSDCELAAQATLTGLEYYSNEHSCKDNGGVNIATSATGCTRQIIANCYDPQSMDIDLFNAGTRVSDAQRKAICESLRNTVHCFDGFKSKCTPETRDALETMETHYQHVCKENGAGFNHINCVIRQEVLDGISHCWNDMSATSGYQRSKAEQKEQCSALQCTWKIIQGHCGKEAADWAWEYYALTQLSNVDQFSCHLDGIDPSKSPAQRPFISSILWLLTMFIVTALICRRMSISG